MRRPQLRPAAIAGALVVALLFGYGIGRANRDGGAPAAAASASLPPHAHGPGPGGAEAANGLSVSAAGYTLYAETTTIQPDTPSTFKFWIIDRGRKPVTRFATVHERQLHLIVVRRDLTGYQHLHPTMDAAGTWTVSLRLPDPGVYRVYADFSATGADGTSTPVILGVDVGVPGPYTPVPLPAETRESTAGPLTVRLEGAAQAGAVGTLWFRISSGGAPASDRLQRYLGAYAHLVAIREGDLALTHTHGSDLTERGVRCLLATPGPGRYRLFLDFQFADTVRTAAYSHVVT
jgi:hypothetical protein